MGQEKSALEQVLLMEKVTVDAIARAEQSVVAIARVRRRGDFVRPGPQPTDPNFVPNEYGTGVVVDAKGLILTNYHVIGDPKENEYYVWAGKRPYRVLAVKAADPWTDLAVLKIDATDMKPITLGDASNLRKGQSVIALGNPYAIARDGEVSASRGIIANLSRKATKNPSNDEDGERRDRLQQNKTLHHYGTLIQVDAKLNLGTSGGALINLKGEMIGLTTSLAAMDRYEKSAGFAIPVDDAFKRTLEKLKAGQKAEFGFLGVGPADLNLDERSRGLLGVRVEHVVQGTPAAYAGLQSGDIITHINDRPIHDSTELMRDLGRQPVEARVKLTVRRTGRMVVTTAKLSKKYVSSSRPTYAQSMESHWRGMQVDYATAIPYFVENSRNIDAEGCVAIVEVDPDSPAWKAGLRPSTFISTVDGKRVTTPKEFYQAVAKKSGAVNVRLSVAQGSTSPVRTVTP